MRFLVEHARRTGTSACSTTATRAPTTAASWSASRSRRGREGRFRGVPRDPGLSVRRRDRQPGLSPVPAVSRGYCERKLSGDGRFGVRRRRVRRAGHGRPARLHDRRRRHAGAHRRRPSPAATATGAGTARGPHAAAAASARCRRPARAGRRQDAGGRRRQRRQLEQDAARALRRTERGGAQARPTAAPGRCRAWRRRRRRAAACRRRRSAPGRRRRCPRAVLERGAITPTRRKRDGASGAPPRRRRPPAARRTAGRGRRAAAPHWSTATAYAGACGGETPKRSAQNTSAAATSDQITNADSRANMRRLSSNASRHRGADR